MSTNHTPGRIKVGKPRKSHANGGLMHHLEGPDTVSDWEDWGFTEESARRLVACWNACEGISTEGLEGDRNAAVGWARTAGKLLRMKTQRDELLQALRECAEELQFMPDDDTYAARQKALAVIAKIGGEA